MPRQPHLLTGIGSHYSRFARSSLDPRVPLGHQVGEPAPSVQEPAAALKRQPKPQDGSMTTMQVRAPPPPPPPAHRQHLADLFDPRAIQFRFSDVCCLSTQQSHRIPC